MQSTDPCEPLTESDRQEIDQSNSLGYFMPTPAEIAAEAEAIREGWSESDHGRKAVEKAGPWEVPVVKAGRW